MNALKTMRTNRGLSQSELAEKSGVDVRMIQHYEQGTKDINRAKAITAVRLSEALRCKIRDILNPDDNL